MHMDNQKAATSLRDTGSENPLGRSTKLKSPTEKEGENLTKETKARRRGDPARPSDQIKSLTRESSMISE